MTATIVTVRTTARTGLRDSNLATAASAVAAPVQANAAAHSGGSLTDTTTYYYVVTAINANGETVASNEKSYTASDPNLTATLSWAASTGATGYKVYRSTSSGTYGASSLLATLGAVLTYNDTGTATSTGTPPTNGTATLGDKWLNTGNETLVVFNGGGEDCVVTVAFNAAAVFDGITVASRTVTVPAGDTMEIGPFPTAIFNDSSGYCTATCDQVDTVTICVRKNGS